jgi:prepilin-type N-terminal cleavage/methylation domain-containing protein
MNIRPQCGIRRRSGFTLLEVAIASAVLAVALFQQLAQETVPLARMQLVQLQVLMRVLLLILTH